MTISCPGDLASFRFQSHDHRRGMTIGAAGWERHKLLLPFCFPPMGYTGAMSTVGSPFVMDGMDWSIQFMLLNLLNTISLLLGVFLAVSSNTRYQIINGLKRLVEASPVAKKVPPVALAFTVGVRFANNIYGGMQFVDWARWSGVQ
ncbi:protein RETICULATA, chloroplastic [Cinnamomum micranthum f. kanehirae]|uniref:Protein RETICULATA, chloroplastic n=1 Tax=Cinnamomum micranthum f. kanehirae TaxID=337451 RepID=A0A443P5U4_9MAGN|nr:protein RETICULATA, chloroplastic [Cinnamomum micranthum f. kanehirae]